MNAAPAGFRLLLSLLLMGLLSRSALAGKPPAGGSRRLPVKEYRDRMKAGWIGQIIGVAWGAPTEGRYRQIMPEDKVPPFRESLVNDAFGQDDLYVEMTFLRSMEQYGLDVPIRQAGIDFANSQYALWVANDAGRRNLRRGIAPPDSSHPRFHRCAGAIDYQIEADYAGLIAPGMPNVVIRLGETFGRLMNYGDGVYAGQFMGAMYAEAFFENDPARLVEAGLKCIPAESLYAGMVRDVLQWWRENPDDWQKTWTLVDKKYRSKEYYLSALDVKLEGAFVLIGLLYGNGDPDKTIVLSMRCGSDSDCNPSSSGGVLCTALGMPKLPERYYRKLDEKAIFSHTSYSFPALVDVCEKLARQAVAASGGRIEKDAAGAEVFVLPVAPPRPSRFDDLRRPGPIAGSRYTAEEMARIKFPDTPAALQKAFGQFAPGWQIKDCGPDMEPGPRAQFGGKKNVFLTHPLDHQTGCRLTRKIDLPAAKNTRLRLVVGHDPRGDFDLVVKADGKQLLKTAVSKHTATGGWLDVSVDLAPCAGKSVSLELINQPNGWSWEAAYWARIELETR